MAQLKQPKGGTKGSRTALAAPPSSPSKPADVPNVAPAPPTVAPVEDLANVPAAVEELVPNDRGSSTAEGDGADPSLARVRGEDPRVLYVQSWPVPPIRGWCRLYQADVRGRPGFYDPPDIHGTMVRTGRIATEYPEIHAWSDLIAEAWHKKPFLDCGPIVRSRIVAAMMYAAHSEKQIGGNARMSGIETYLTDLRADATRAALDVISTIVQFAAAASHLLVNSGSRAGRVIQTVSRATNIGAMSVQVVRGIHDGAMDPTRTLEALGEAIGKVHDIDDVEKDEAMVMDVVHAVHGILEDLVPPSSANERRIDLP